MSTPKWPHDHSEKHAAAARLGWERRRGRLHRPTKRNEARVQRKQNDYEQWKAQYERLADDIRHGSTQERQLSAMRQHSAHGLAHPGYSARYRKEQGIKLPGEDQKRKKKSRKR